MTVMILAQDVLCTYGVFFLLRLGLGIGTWIQVFLFFFWLWLRHFSLSHDKQNKKEALFRQWLWFLLLACNHRLRELSVFKTNRSQTTAVTVFDVCARRTRHDVRRWQGATERVAKWTSEPFRFLDTVLVCDTVGEKTTFQNSGDDDCCRCWWVVVFGWPLFPIVFRMQLWS